MITRIVRLSIRQEVKNAFLSSFSEAEKEIRNFPGCLHLELLRDANDENIFFTLSRWQSTEDLEQYRQSPLFRKTWAQVKPLFRDKAMTFSMQECPLPR